MTSYYSDIKNLSKLNNNQCGGMKIEEGLSLWGRINIIIPSIMMIIVGIFLVIYGITVRIQDEPKIIQKKVKITKILNVNDFEKSCKPSIMTTSTSGRRSSSTRSYTAYNCVIYFNVDGTEKHINIKDSIKNYMEGDEITVWHDMDKNAYMINYYSFKKYWFLFIIIGLVLIGLTLSFVKYVWSNNTAATVAGLIDISNRF